MIQNSYGYKIESIGVPIIDYKELEELNIVQSWSGYPCKKANVFR